MVRNQQQRRLNGQHNQGINNIRPNNAQLLIINEDQDYISSLNDDLLNMILSLLPFKCAFQTIILSMRWKSLWETHSIKNIFNEDEENRVRPQDKMDGDQSLTILQNFESFIDQHLQNYKIIRFEFDYGIFVLASINGEMKLKMDFFPLENQLLRPRMHWLPICYYDYWGILLCRRDLSPTNILDSVKNLYLKSANRFVQAIVRTMVDRLYRLEELTVVKCNAIMGINVIVDPYLRSLKVFDCPNIRQIYISSNLVTRFHYRGLLPNIWMKPGGTDVVLDVTSGVSVMEYILLNRTCMDLRYSLRIVNTITLCGWLFEINLMWWLDPRQTRFTELKEVRWLDTPLNTKYKMEAFISFLKMSPNVEKVFIKIDPTYHRVQYESTWWSDDVEEKEERMEAISAQKQKKLKLVVLEGFTKREEILLINRLLKQILWGKLGWTKIFSVSEENGIRRLVKITQNQQRMVQEVGPQNRPRIIGDENSGYVYEFRQENQNLVLPLPVHSSTIN